MPPPTNRIIDYAEPKPPVSAARVLAGVFGALIGVFGVLAISIGLIGLLPYGGVWDGIGACPMVALLLGVIALVLSIRLGRYAVRGPAE